MKTPSRTDGVILKPSLHTIQMPTMRATGTPHEQSFRRQLTQRTSGGFNSTVEANTLV